ncbi:BMP family ABC transporter substrate-binding protein (plasmid) [Kitasatospora sp. NBC_00070]|uniref:BMP family lipoprotein n=1 Tax=Kitasatospora sp. NBC_00070 TaxID=2975962 RepID=UPI00324B9F5F
MATLLTLASCGSGGGSDRPKASGPYKACMVADTGGLEDRSFNAEALAGMQQAAKADKSITVDTVNSASANDYAGNIAKFVSQDCDLVVTVGFSMGDATLESAKQNPSQNYTIVDSQSTPPQIKGLQFNTAQGAFLGGYFAAGMTQTGKIATFGGAKFPSVTVYMDGFWEGAQYYNREHSTKVEVLGWDEPSQSGTFTNPQSFTDPEGGRQISQAFQEQGADIIFPVAGGTGIGALTQAKASNGKMNVIWVDNDGFYSNADYGSVIMTSVVKGIASAVSTVVTAAADGSFNATSYVGTLANHGTDLAPYHDFTSRVPTSLISELTATRQNIINGTIKLISPNQPAP